MPGKVYESSRSVQILLLSAPNAQGKRQMGYSLKLRVHLADFPSVFNFTNSFNGVGVRVPSADAAFSQNLVTQEMLNQLIPQENGHLYTLWYMLNQVIAQEYGRLYIPLHMYHVTLFSSYYYYFCMLEI